MKYYAVTDDPNELMHFGIKGMKWGVVRTPEQLGHHKAPKKVKPRSPAYMKASAKLSSAMQRGIARAQANWSAYQSPAAKAYRAEQRHEKKFEKNLQRAREGRLKYKGISDEDVYRIQDRLAIENQTRAMSGREKQSFRRRLNERIGEGIIEGVGRGTSNYINERMTGRGRTTAEIKGARRKVRAQLTIPGLVNRARENIVGKLDTSREASRDSYKQAKAEEAEYKALAAQYGHNMGGSRNSKFLSYNPNDRITVAERQKRIAQMREAQDKHNYEIKRRYDDSNDASMVREALRQQRQDEMSVYRERLAANNEARKNYNTARNDWNKLPDDVKQTTPQPTEADYGVVARIDPPPKFNVNNFFNDYDTEMENRRKRRGWT